MSTIRDTQYITQPPDIPEFLFKTSKVAWDELISWANLEWKNRMMYLAKHGYWKELRSMSQNSSPMRILAEMHGFRRYCSIITEKVWHQFSMRDRVFIRRSYELRDLLLR